MYSSTAGNLSSLARLSLIASAALAIGVRSFPGDAVGADELGCWAVLLCGWGSKVARGMVEEGAVWNNGGRLNSGGGSCALPGAGVAANAPGIGRCGVAGIAYAIFVFLKGAKGSTVLRRPVIRAGNVGMPYGSAR